ncbi:predicted protein [Nematostella vectensis]|uniref:Uncharacterized protein n=1 Tax=Nematostella vectensis TaxID=45351 RepID=A7S7Y6_NEMVE|nr:rho-related GTP-binding protein RhoU [Nematostella vectensis]EDO40156.1 predicted protein [Nematostella vectensis]|eukprot:XP_001632219.1 predicted protein [Nematostella vectensis]
MEHTNDKQPLVLERKKEQLKCVIVGDGGVGKTSLLVSYMMDGFPNSYVPTAFDTYHVTVEVNKKLCMIEFCDTAGQEDFDALRPLCYSSADVFIVCFSVVSPTSFANVASKWIPEIREFQPKAPIILVGTHSDLKDCYKILTELSQQDSQPISVKKAEGLVKKTRCVCYVETSSVTQKNLKTVFDEAIISGYLPPKGGRTLDLRGCVCGVM